MFRGKSTFEALSKDTLGAYASTMSFVRENLREQMYSPALDAALGGYERGARCSVATAAARPTDDPLAQVQYIDLKTYLVGDINTKVDRASMAHSLEVREPLMDHELVEWLARLPSSLKIRGGEGKYLLKKAMEPHLPSDVLYRPKMGFAVPLAAWFRGPLRERAREALLGPRMLDTGFFDAIDTPSHARCPRARHVGLRHAVVDAADVRRVPAIAVGIDARQCRIHCQLPSIVSVCRALPSDAQPSSHIFVLQRIAAMCTSRVGRGHRARAVFPSDQAAPRTRAHGGPRSLGVRIEPVPMLHLPGVPRFNGCFMRRAIATSLRKRRSGGRLDIIDAHFGYPEGLASVPLARALGAACVRHAAWIRGGPARGPDQSTAARRGAEPRRRPDLRQPFAAAERCSTPASTIAF